MSNLHEGKIALITGASRGIGRTLAITLAREGCTVVVNYKKNADLAHEVVEEIGKAGGAGLAVQADVETEDGIGSLFDAVAEEYGRWTSSWPTRRRVRSRTSSISSPTTSTARTR